MGLIPDAEPSIPESIHGALDYNELQALGLEPDRIIDFSANVNPYGPSLRVGEILTTVPVGRYPDREVIALREALAVYHGVSPDHIIVGNGAAELIWLVALAFVHPGDVAVVLAPTFAEYARSVHMMHGRVVEWRARPEDTFTIHTQEVADLLAHTQPRLCFLCNPNNPTGQIYSLEALAAWADAHPRTLFVVDEAYINFVPGLVSALNLKRGHILVLRSMTKDYALAGLRLGYAVGHVDVVAAMRQVQPPWSVNAVAQVAGVAALSDQNHLRVTIAATLREKETFVARLRYLGLDVVPSATHFFLARVGNARRFRQALLAHGILVRDSASFGLPEYVRISTRLPGENSLLISCLHNQDRGPKVENWRRREP